jgi:beta-N-acetylhexosaminidase
MQALGGSLQERARGALAAGCDLVLHCNGDIAEMSGVAAAISGLGEAARRRLAAGEARRQAPGMFDRFDAERRLAALLRDSA